MTSRSSDMGKDNESDLMMGKVLERMCDRNDHETVLQVLQVLGKARRAGYLSISELVMCLIYCGNRFAEQNNGDFFKEYVHYMPDINAIPDVNRSFTPLCKSYYYAYKYAEGELDTIQTECMLLDTATLLPWFQKFIIRRSIISTWQLEPFFDKIKPYGESINNSQFKQLAESYQVPIQMKTGN
jgi:hypothetical protein